uniref:Secreted protein n=1 Tax=Otus sunia TaxID=257818 RepID=A0A8C8B6B1_9STRI
MFIFLSLLYYPVSLLCRNESASISVQFAATLHLRERHSSAEIRKQFTLQPGFAQFCQRSLSTPGFSTLHLVSSGFIFFTQVRHLHCLMLLG